ncbi:PQQ-binding-like beta-propeller repeat protein [Prosthecobacter sp. SYSU 5D2]|uniref:PQQ-binding-like beta-propeller repeat protein n=1 Tax=Prosthecobacter sp. SYSU 5D2 TaxID=3134134 RepID=UPI0031FEFF06
MMRLPLLLFFFTVSFAAAENWPEWRGVGGQGISAAKSLPETWSETSGVAWKTELPGRGHSTPVIWGEQIWLTTAIEKAASAEEAEKRLKNNTGDQPVTVLESVSLRAVCVDRASGKILQEVELLNVKEPQWVHQLNSYASPSPIIEEGRLYAHFGSFGTACLDTVTHEVLWKNQELQIMHENGPGSTPVVWEKLLVIHFDGSDQQFIAAFDKENGKLVWKTARTGEMRENPQQRKAYGTPLVLEMNGKPVVVSPAADWIYGYEAATGKELWKVPYGELGFSMSVRPVADESQIYFSTCFGKSQVMALKYAGLEVPEVAWRNNKNAPKMCSPVLANGLLFYVDDGGIVSCVDCQTGEALYRERLGGKFSASPILADGKLYFSSREGVVTVVPAAKEFKILAQNSLDGGLMASPVAVDGVLYLRTDKALYKIGGK